MCTLYNMIEAVFNRTTVISDFAFGVLSLVFWVKQCFVEQANLMFFFFLASCPSSLNRIFASQALSCYVPAPVVDQADRHTRDACEG